MPHARRQPAGFTLVEVMTSISLMAILTALTVSSLSGLRERVVARQGAQLVHRAMVAARQRASATGRCVRVEILDGSMTALPSGSSAPAAALRLRSWKSPHCEADAADSLEAGGELRSLPQGVSVVRLAPAGPASADWLPSGRTRDGLRTTVAVSYAAASFVVIASPQGPVCIRDSLAGACP